jgi:phosphatidylglycerophosphate synthase
MDRLGKSIIGSVLSFCALQLAIFTAFALLAEPSAADLPRGFLGRYGPAYGAVSVAYYGCLISLLFLFKTSFVKIPSGEMLERVNLANAITMFRLTSMPTILFLVLAAKEYRIRLPLLCLVVLVFATDFLDGYISRKAGEVTKVGKMMDSASDYSLLIVLTVVFYYFKLVPPWFFILVTARLGLQVVLVFLLIFINRKVEPKTTFLGKAAVASIMVLYAIEVVRLIFGIGSLPLFAVLEWTVAGIVAVSMIDKIIAFARELPGK